MLNPITLFLGQQRRATTAILYRAISWAEIVHTQKINHHMKYLHDVRGKNNIS